MRGDPMGMRGMRGIDARGEITDDDCGMTDDHSGMNKNNGRARYKYLSDPVERRAAAAYRSNLIKIYEDD